MPDNEVEERLQNLFELENISQCQILSQSVGGNWPVLNHSHWVGREGQFAAPLDLNPRYFSERKLDSVKVACDQSFVELTPRAQNFRSNSRNPWLNTNERLLECRNFQTKQNQPTIEGEITGYDHHGLSSRGSSIFQSQQATECVDSPTLTTNSGRSEITEVSTDFNFLRGQQPEREQQASSPQSRIMQQPAYNDMQLLQQHVMFKKLEELQQQQRQRQQSGDMRQQNSLSQLSAFAKQTAGGQFPPLINGTPVHDTSQVFRNWVQQGACPAGQGIPNRVMISQEQGQTSPSMGVVPQLHDISLFGTPIANARGNLSQYSHLQELTNDSVNLMASASGQVQKPTMQSASFDNPFLGDRHIVSGEQVVMSQGAFIPKQGSQGRNIYGQLPAHGLNTGGFSGNPQEGNMLQTSASLKEFAGKQEQAGWPSMQQTTKQLVPSQGFVPLDPLEEKILYNMDDNTWDASFGRRSDMDTGFSGNSLEHTVPSDKLPSIHSGSWSALMQSAVAESSSSDTGLQEEWSGLTFQNTDQSTDNPLPNFMDSEKQQTGWVDSNLQNTSLNSKPFPMFNDGNINSSFPGFQQAAVQFSMEGREGVRQDGSHEAIEYCNPQQKSSIEENQRVQSFMHLDNALASQMHMHAHAESNAHNQRIASQNNVGQSCGNGAINQGTFPDAFMWKGDGNGGASSFSRSNGETEQVQSEADRSPPNTENSQIPNFSAATSSSIFKTHLSTNQYIPDSNQTDYKEQITVSVDNRGNERVRKIQQVGNNPLVAHNYYGGANATFEKQQNCYQNENSNNCYTSKELIGHEQGHFGQFKSLSDVSNCSNLDKGCLPDLQRNAKVQEAATSRGDLVDTFHSQNMLELLHKVDQSRNDGSLANFGSSDYISSPQRPRAETPNASSSQLYYQSSSSQGFGLRLVSPSQRSLNSNLILSPQSSWKAAGNLNSEQASTEFGVKSPTWLTPQSALQSLTTLCKQHQEAHYDSRFGSPGHTGNSSILNMRGGSYASVTPSPPYNKNQLQMHFMSNISTAPQSSRGISPSLANRYPQFNRAPFQDTSQQMFPNPLSQQIPVLGNVPVSQPSIVSGMSQQCEISAEPDSLWKNILPQQQPLDVKSLEVSSNLTSSLDQSNNGILSTLVPQGSTHHNSEKGENYGEFSMKTLGFAHVDEQAAKERSLQQTSNEMPNASKISGCLSRVQESVENLVSGAAGLASGSFVGYSRLHEPDRIRNNNNPPNSVQSGDSKMLNFLTEARESLTVKVLQQPTVKDIYSPETAGFGQNVSQNQSGSINAVSNNTDRGQIDMRMAPSWFKQYGRLKNGQMVPMYEAGVGKMAVSLGKSSQNLHSHPSTERLDGADASHGGRVWPRTDATLVPDKHILVPYVLPSDAAKQTTGIMRQKKRKIATIEPLPWYKEVIEGFRGLQAICMAGQEWAQATNRLIEKVQYEVEMIEDLQQSLRSKRRLIMTTQVMHQLFRPAPATLMLADVALHYESVSYFVSKLAVGDACSLANCARNSLLVPVDDDNMEKHKDTKKCSDQQFSEFVEEVIGRANKLESEFQRLDKSASIVDLRVECQDLERFAVINRFAKFHSQSRGQLDRSGPSFPSGPPRSFPQRYVAALPMPRNIPEGVQCLSL